MNTKGQQNHIYGVDLVRFLAALSVAFFHWSWKVPNHSNFMPIGWVGVQVFFIISGLVIANSASHTTPFKFLRNRFMRLYPTAWIAAIINYLVLISVPVVAYKMLGIHIYESLHSLLYSMTLIGSKHLASAYWTLPVELAFYSLVFLLISIKSNFNLKYLAYFLILWSAPYNIILFLSSSAYINMPSIDLGYGLMNCTLLRHGSYFAIGIIISQCATNGYKSLDRIAIALAIISSVFEIYSRALELAPSYATNSNGFIINHETLFLEAWLAFILGTLFIYFSYAYKHTFNPLPQFKGVFRIIGLTTYPYYLMHEIIGGMVIYYLVSHGVGLVPSIFMAAFFVFATSSLVAAKAEPLLRRHIDSLVGQIGMQYKKQN